MNELKRQVVRGLYKEAGVKQDIAKFFTGLKNKAVSVKDAVVKNYKENPEIYKRVGIDAAGAAGANLLGMVSDAVTGNQTTGKSVLLRTLLGIGGAEAGQYAWNKYQDMAARAGDPNALKARDAANINKGKQLLLEEQAINAKKAAEADAAKKQAAVDAENAHYAKLWRDQQAQQKAEAEAKAKAKAAEDTRLADEYRRQQKEDQLRSQMSQERSKQNKINSRLGFMDAVLWLQDKLQGTK